MSKKGLVWIILMALLMGFVALPETIKSKFPNDPISTWLKNQKVTLGLDLQGGTQLDYRIDLRNAETKNSDEDPSNDVQVRDIIEGVRNTLERRVNNLGVSEPQIYTSTVAGEEHIVVELAGIKDIEEAKKVVGKTIQLEFKEPKTEPDPGETDRIRKQANEALAKARSGSGDFATVGLSTATSDKKIEFRPEKKTFVSSLPAHYKEVLPKLKAGDVHRDLLENTGDYTVGLDGTIVERKGLLIVKLLNRGMEERTVNETDETTKEPKEVKKTEEAFTYSEIFFDTAHDPWKLTGLDGAHFKNATIVYGQLGEPQVSIEFDADGGRMFEELTGRLVSQRLAIFVGGELISAPNVNEKIAGGSAVITGSFSVQEALRLANDLNTGAIDAPVVLSGQYTISATLGENALRVSLMAGLIGVIALTLFMLLYYRLLGFFAVISLTIYSVIIVFLLKTTPLVMTLAGIAGIILSIGMAVDANILIFERTREELNLGKNFIAAISAGFDRAWSSIRDSNVSSLITCAILWFFGNSIIRGFALMLALGILISMFTAITVTRKLLQTIAGREISKNRWLLGAKKLEIAK